MRECHYSVSSTSSVLLDKIKLVEIRLTQLFHSVVSTVILIHWIIVMTVQLHTVEK